MNENLKKFFDLNKVVIEKNLEIYMKTLSTYRENIRYVYFEDKTNTLSYEFTFKIYNDITLSKEDLKNLFLKEKNPQIKEIGEKMETNPKIHFLFDYMSRMNESMMHCWWILFWHDLWNLNKFFKDFTKPDKFTTIFNVHKQNNIAQKYEEFKDRTSLVVLITNEKKWKYFNKRKLFESILTMLGKIKSREEIEKRRMTMSPEDRRLNEMDDGNMESSSFADRKGSPKAGNTKNKFFSMFSPKSKTKKNEIEEQSPTSLLNNSNILEMKTGIIHIQSAEERSPTEGERLINNSNPQDFITDIENIVNKKDALDEFVDEENKE